MLQSCWTELYITISIWVQFVAGSSWRCDVPIGNCSLSTTIAECAAQRTQFRLLLMTGPKPLAKQILRTAQCNAVHLLQFVVSLRSSSSCQCIIPRLFILPSTFPSIMCSRRQFLHNMWPVQLTFLLFAVCRIFLCYLHLCNTSSLTLSIQLIFSILLQHHISKLSKYFWSTSRSVQLSAPHQAVLKS